jgi:hypothetical protein
MLFYPENSEFLFAVVPRRGRLNPFKKMALWGFLGFTTNYHENSRQFGLIRCKKQVNPAKS